MLPVPLRRLRLPRSLYDEMIAQARAELPRECCGLLAGTTAEDGNGLVEARYPLVNALASPVEYLSDSQSMFAAWKDIRRRGIELLAVYHSHPTSAPVPSKKDLAQSFYPDMVNLIISLAEDPPLVCGWWLAADSYREADWQVVEAGSAPGP